MENIVVKIIYTILHYLHGSLNMLVSLSITEDKHNFNLKKEGYKNDFKRYSCDK